jgi:hydroxymethylbilane synthase
VAIEIHDSLHPDKKAAIRSCVNDEKSERCLLAERAFLAKLEGGCSIPVFGLASLDGPNISLTAGIISLDGSERIIRKAFGKDPLALGQSVANEILEAGGDKILAEIKNQL